MSITPPLPLPAPPARTGDEIPISVPPPLEPLWASFGPFQLALQILHRKNVENNSKIEDFGLPKLLQNSLKILSRSMSRKTRSVLSIFVRFFIFFNLRFLKNVHFT